MLKYAMTDISEIASLLQLSIVANHVFKLWMGTHVSLPSRTHWVQGASISLTGHPTAGGPIPKLDFLLKVLSIRHALAVQAHPDHKLASQLHAEDNRFHSMRSIRLVRHFLITA